MKKLICLVMVVVMMFSVPVYAKDIEDIAVLRQKDSIIAFNPSILLVQNQKSTMVVNIDAVTCAYMYQVQWSDEPDFENSENRFFRNSDNRGAMIIDYDHVRQNGKLYAVRTVWYGGYKLSFRKKEVKSTKERLFPVPNDLILYLYSRYRISKRLYVPNKGKYVRVRGIYYGFGDYAYSDWSEPVKVW